MYRHHFILYAMRWKMSFSQYYRHKCRLSVHHFHFFRCKRKSLWIFYMACCFDVHQKSSVKYQFTKYMMQTECESLKSIPDCSGVKSTICCTHRTNRSPLWKWSDIFHFFRIGSVNTFSMKNYGFVEQQCLKWYSNGMVWFQSHRVNFTRQMERRTNELFVLIKMWNGNNAFSIMVMFLSF